MTSNEAGPVAAQGRLRVRMVSPIHLPPETMQLRARRLAELGGRELAVDLVGLPPDAPRALDSAEAVSQAGRYVAQEAARVTPDDADLVMPDCILDPGLELCRESAVPVVGLLQITAGGLVNLRRKFSAVVRNEAIGAELQRQMQMYGWSDALLGVDVLNLGIEMVAHEAEWNALTDRVLDERAAAGINTVYNGCSAVASAAQPPGRWLVDPSRYAFDLLRATVVNRETCLS